MNITSLVNKKCMKRKVRVLVLAAAAIATVSVSQPARAQSGSGLGAPIEGTWIIQVHRVTQNITFTALQSFTAGGVTLATGTIDRTPPPPISPLYGTWRRTGHNSYSVAICFFVFDSAGNAVAMIKTPETFQMVNNDNLTGSGTALACDIHGDNCVDTNSPITITGKRLIVEDVSN